MQAVIIASFAEFWSLSSAIELASHINIQRRLSRFA
jgi:hypothetical protein